MAMPAPRRADPRWWRTAVGYEVYLRSFADGDGDGLGDLRGLHDHLGHLVWLGVDMVWITPFYPSPMADHGYDITDHTAVDPRYGSLADLDAVVERAHELGLRVLIDLVPNHTSDRHPWFRASRADPGGRYRSWYHWRDPGPDGGPPNNWCSYFGGPAWSHDEASGQWWAHLFLPEQPDLNWEEPAVVAAFDEIIEFWLERGVDGFRIDVAQGLAKHPSYADNPLRSPEPVGAGPRAEWAAQDHLHDIGQPGSLEIFSRWRGLAAAHDAVLLGEVYLDDPAAVGTYVADDGLHLAFSFAFADLPWEADSVRSALALTMDHLGPGACWTQTSHDERRPPTRFGGGDRGRARALAITTLLAGMPGPLMLYQGEELGLEDGQLAAGSVQDPLGDRDGCRTPMPWSTAPGWGFTDASDPWLPYGGRRPEDTVAEQRADEQSWLHRHRRLLEVRRRIDADAPLRWCHDGAVVAYQRDRHLVAVSVHDRPQRFDPPGDGWSIAFSSDPHRRLTSMGASLRLAPAEAVILEHGTVR